MAFTYGSEALNQLAQEVSREPADLSTKADASALATTNAVVGTKQTAGEPVKYDAQVITANTTLDPDIAYWLLDASGNAVTLTFPTVGSVEGRQFTVTVLNSDNPAVIAAQAGEFFMLAGKPSASVSLQSGATMVLVARTVPGLPPIWVSQGIVNPVAACSAFTFDTTAGNLFGGPQSAADLAGCLQAFKNIGTGGHDLFINPHSTDTIDGGPGPVTVMDGKTATLVREDTVATNWILISLV